MLANESEFRVKVAVRVSRLKDLLIIDFSFSFHLGSTVLTTRKKS